MPERATAAGRVTSVGMDRLAFTLPDFTRVAWVSDVAREVWQPRLARITAAWREIEWRACAAGVRRCAIATVTPEELVDEAPRWSEAGLSVVPIEIMGVSGQPYSATHVQRLPGEPFVFRSVVGRSDDLNAFKRAWDAADDEAIGALLGYPACCRAFFRRVWVDDGMVDTTWPMAIASVTAPGTTVELDGPAQANILWRWMGARAVPHLPCRFDCAPTIELADQLVAVGRDAGLGIEMDWLLEILSWPVQWSALHGIAEIKTPVLRVSTRTDATTRRYVVRHVGSAYPPEGARGLGLPFRSPVKLLLTNTRGFRRGLVNATDNTRHRKPWYSSDNGFASESDMRDAHRPVVDVATAALGRRGGNVVDLGCGNGALLERIAAATRGIVPFGIDADASRVEHAHELHPAFVDNFVTGDLFDDESLWAAHRRYALAIFMPGRVLEVGAERARALLTRLRTQCDAVLIYAYGDWLDRFGGLDELARRAGIAVLGEPGRPVALATIVPAIPEEVLDGA